MGENGARGKDWVRARGASPVSYRHNFLVYFQIWRVKAAKSENKKGFSISEKACIRDNCIQKCHLGR